MKAIALLSGGLDSTLSTKLINELGIEVIALNFKTPFCLCDRRSSGGCGSHSRNVAENLNIGFKVINVTDEFFTILKNPKYGYGSNMNPCIDCRILLFKKAREVMLSEGASFIITGEVLGQRPMSQHKQALKIIEKESGLEGLVLRPLSARLLPETIPERNGWVSRDKLWNFNGRTRRPQIRLAEELKIKDYPCSSGGCLLTDSEFSKRIKDLIRYGELDLNNVELLKIGRHFRLSPHTKLVVGRNELENGRIINLAKETDCLFRPLDIAGPTALGRGVFDDGLIKLSGSIVCRYCDLDGSITAKIAYERVSETGIVPCGDSPCIEASPIGDAKLTSLRL